MGRARPTVIGIQATILTGDRTTTMVGRYRGKTVGGEAIEAGGRIDQSSGSGTLVVRDQNGVELHNASTGADITIAPVPRGVRLPLEVVTSGSSTFVGTVFWSVKK